MRDAYWDVVKGAGVVCVLLCHTGGPPAPFLYMYTLSIFFFVAGYFYKEKYTEKPFLYIGTRLQHLWWPSAKFAVLFVLLHNLFFSLGFYTAVPGIPHAGVYAPYSLQQMAVQLVHAFTLLALEELVSALWFVEMMLADLFMLCGISYVCRQLPAGWRREGLVFLFSAGIYLLGCWFLKNKIYPEYYFHTACLLFVPVYMGYAYRRLERHIPLHWLGGLAAAAVTLGVYVHTGTWVEFSQNRIIGMKWFLLVHVSGLYFHLWLCRQLQRWGGARAFLARVGQDGLAIIALHFIAFKAAGFVYIKAEGLSMDLLASFPMAGYPLEQGSWWLFFTAVGILLPMGVLELYRRGRAMAAVRLSRWLSKNEQGRLG